MCVCGLIYLACKAHAPFYIICGLSVSARFFPHYLINSTIFGKTLLNIKCVFWFSVQLLSELFLILGRVQRVIFINVHRSSCEVPVVIRSRCSGPERARTQTPFFCSVPLFLCYCNETWICSTDFHKILKYQISWKSVQWQPSCSMQACRQADGRTDMAEEDNSCFF